MRKWVTNCRYEIHLRNGVVKRIHADSYSYERWGTYDFYRRWFNDDKKKEMTVSVATFNAEDVVYVISLEDDVETIVESKDEDNSGNS